MKNLIATTTLCLVLTLLALSAQHTDTKETQSLEPGESTTPHHILVKHPGFLSKDPMPYTLYQIKNQEGFPTEYTMVVDSVICLHEQCEIIKVTMVWDALGQYDRYELLPGTTLTKSPEKPSGKQSNWREESLPFTEKDYDKLDSLLRDTSSILKDHTIESISPAVKSDEVDAITGATPQTLRQSIVRGAAYTCYNLWHWAHGEVTAIAKGLTHNRCDKALLNHFLASDQQHYVEFALDHLRQHRVFNPDTVKNVKEIISKGNAKHTELGLAYLEEAMADTTLFYSTLVEIFSSCKTDGRLHLLDYLTAKENLPASLYEALSVHFSDLTTYYEVHRLLGLIENQAAISPKILLNISELLQNNNFFIARRAFWFLREQELDDELTLRIQTFLEQHPDRHEDLNL